jgi:hypothetical protein
MKGRNVVMLLVFLLIGFLPIFVMELSGMREEAYIKQQSLNGKMPLNIINWQRVQISS